MGVQTAYNFATSRGVAGGLYDLSPYASDSRLNGETVAGALKFGMGVVGGSAPGANVKRPAAGATPANFEGIVMTGFTTEQDINGNVVVMPGQTVGLLRYGRVWVRIKDGIAPEYGEPLHLIVDGDDAGLFTNAADVPAEGAASKTIAVKGRFIGGKGSGNVAPVELFNQAQN